MFDFQLQLMIAIIADSNSTALTMGPSEAKKSRYAVSERGVLRIECNGLSNSECMWRSKQVEVAGRWWYADVSIETNENNNNRKFIKTKLKCNDKSIIKMDVDYVFLNENSARNIIKRAPSYFKDGYDIKYDDFRELYATDEAEGFVKDDRMVIEIRIYMKGMAPGGQWPPVFRRETPIPFDFSADIDFTNVNDPRHDIVFVIGGEKIYAGKQIISVHSPVLAAKLYGEWKDLKEIELEEVNRDEFLELLRVIYPSTQGITDSNVISLLKLADRFEIKLITELAEHHLISSTSETLVSKFLLADKHKLANLKDYCFSSLKTVEDFKAVKESSIYNDLSDATKVAFFEKWVSKDR